MTRWPSLRAALADLAGKHPVEQAKALQARGVDWHLAEQSREAERECALRNLAAIFAQKHADAINPALDAIRAVNERRATERREEYEDIIRGGVALRQIAETNKRIAAEQAAVAKIRRVA